MPIKRKGANLSRNTSRSRSMRNKRAQRTEEQIQQQNTDARVSMAQLRLLRQEQSEDTRAEHNEVIRLKQRQSRRFTVNRRRTNDQQRQQGTKVCDIGDDVKETLRKFRFRKTTKNAALIMKVDREKQQVCVDEMLDDVTLDELREILPGHQPRYIIYCCKMEHEDGRVSFPMCFIYFTPRDSHMELQIMYAGTKMALQREANLTRVYEVRELDEMTDEWLQDCVMGK